MTLIDFLCSKVGETWSNLEGLDFSSVAVSRSPNSGQSIRDTARKIRAYHGWNETDSNSNGPKVRKLFLFLLTNSIWKGKVLCSLCIGKVNSLPVTVYYINWIVRLKSPCMWPTWH